MLSSDISQQENKFCWGKDILHCKSFHDSKTARQQQQRQPADDKVHRS